MPASASTCDRFRLLVRLAFAAGLVAYATALQFATAGLGSVDGYFHIRYSALVRAGGWRHFPPAFPWLPLTVLGPDRYADHHMLFHVLQAPFAGGDMIRGAKGLAAAGAALVFLAAYAILLRQRVRRAEWWMIALLAGAPGFLYRIEMPRVQAWSLLCLLLALALLMHRRDTWFFPLAWLYTWLYDAFPLLLILCAAHAVAHGLCARTVRWKPLAFATAGVIAGLVLNPYFPANLRFIAHHYLAKLDLRDVPVGAEWYPLPIAEWFGWSGLLALLVCLAVVLYRVRRALDPERLTAVLVAAAFLALLWRSSRFVEYFVPFAALALALTAHEAIDAVAARCSFRARRRVAAALLVWLAATTGGAVWQLRGRPAPDRYAAAARWIADHTVPGSLVFLAAWDDFPLFFFHNTANAYVIGLDPTYLAERDPERYRLWARIAAGDAPEPARRIRDDFGASTAAASRDQSRFIAAMERDPLARRAYADDEAVVFVMRPAPRVASAAD